MPTPARPQRLLVTAVVGAAAAVAAVLVLVLVRALATPTTPVDVTAEGSISAVRDGYVLWGVDDDGEPVRWDPCSPIRWVADGAPAGVEPTILEAMDRIEAASGIAFERVGTTDERPATDRPLLQVERYGDDWAPVLISFVDPDDTDVPLDDDTRALAVPVAVDGPDGRTFVSGQLVLNAEKDLQPGFGDRHTSWGATILHELGHLVGLDHVDDASQLMAPTPGFGPVELGDGDLAGLRALGRGGCRAVPPARDVDVVYELSDG